MHRHACAADACLSADIAARRCDMCSDAFGLACLTCSAAAGCTSCDQGWVLEQRGRQTSCKRRNAISTKCEAIGAGNGDLGFKCSPNANLGALQSFLDPGCTVGCTPSAGCKAPKNCPAGTRFVRPCGSAVGMCLDCNVSRGAGRGAGAGGERQASASACCQAWWGGGCTPLRGGAACTPYD